jgi:hypothetical protein
MVLDHERAITMKREFGVMIFLEDTDDWNALIEAFRQAGFHAIKIKPRRESDEDEDSADDFLFVTKHHHADDDTALYDAVRSIILSLGGDPDLNELGPAGMDCIRAQISHALN